MTPPAHPVALALCAFLAAVSAAAAPADIAPATQDAGADQESETLMLKVERQVLAGRTVAPMEDNALATWEQVRKRAQEPTPAFIRAVDDFIKESKNRAAAERAAGREMAAFDLQAFADMAQELLQRAAARSPAAAPAAAPAPADEQPEAAAASTPAPANVAPPAEPAAASVKLQAAVASAPASAAPPVAEPAAGSVKLPAAGDAAHALAAPVASAPRQATPAQERMAVNLASRGDAMLGIKDISAARKLYEQAANLGSAAAAAELARTYDPDYVGKLNVIGIRPDLTLAANWYVRAAALGDRQAAQRMHEIDAMLSSQPSARATP